MASRPLLRVRGIDGATHRACRAMQAERLTFVRHICLGSMPSLIPFKGVLLPSVPALHVKLDQGLPSVLLLQVRTPFPDQSGQLSAAIPPLPSTSNPTEGGQQWLIKLFCMTPLHVKEGRELEPIPEHGWDLALLRDCLSRGIAFAVLTALQPHSSS